MIVWLRKSFIYNLPKFVLKVTVMWLSTSKEMDIMYKLNEWNENENSSLYKSLKNSSINTSCCIDTTKISGSCCIDTVNGPCGDDINTSCCIDTVKE